MADKKVLAVCNTNITLINSPRSEHVDNIRPRLVVMTHTLANQVGKKLVRVLREDLETSLTDIDFEGIWKEAKGDEKAALVAFDKAVKAKASKVEVAKE